MLLAGKRKEERTTPFCISGDLSARWKALNYLRVKPCLWMETRVADVVHVLLIAGPQPWALLQLKQHMVLCVNTNCFHLLKSSF